MFVYIHIYIYIVGKKINVDSNIYVFQSGLQIINSKSVDTVKWFTKTFPTWHNLMYYFIETWNIKTSILLRGIKQLEMCLFCKKCAEMAM